jgi:hypothetical protein
MRYRLPHFKARLARDPVIDSDLAEIAVNLYDASIVER